jgi:capsular exopolysaccharide synthesis family protein
MSRVFEALNKATQEKKQPLEPQAQPEVSGPALATELENHHEQFEWGLNGNGKVAEIPFSLPPIHTNGHKSWRERIEELFFGWDLRRYVSHPIVALEQDSAASEQYKILREQLKRLRIESGVRSFAISSPVKKDGKTTVAVNLAAALALEYEEKVLLIDGDLRAPGVHRYFNLPGSPGLADYLVSNSRGSVKNLVRETHLSGLSVLPAGKPTHFASELLAKEMMSRVMNEVRAEYPGHLIIVDSPPVLATPDPLVLARQVDGILLVIRAGRTPRDYLAKALQSFNSSKILGVVLNGADFGIASQHYYYSSSNGH